ncbi:MAG: hypothetical protein Q4E22_04035 [Coriobacteriia bacterium]|nr:hypothetical protein [Coriobacteriia bacterium]
MSFKKIVYGIVAFFLAAVICVPAAYATEPYEDYLPHEETYWGLAKRDYFGNTPEQYEAWKAYQTAEQAADDAAQNMYDSHHKYHEVLDKHQFRYPEDDEYLNAYLDAKGAYHDTLYSNFCYLDAKYIFIPQYIEKLEEEESKAHPNQKKIDYFRGMISINQEDVDKGYANQEELGKLEKAEKVARRNFELYSTVNPEVKSAIIELSDAEYFHLENANNFAMAFKALIGTGYFDLVPPAPPLPLSLKPYTQNPNQNLK